MLTWQEITDAYNNCRCGIIILTRAFWPNSEWRTKVEAVLGHPYLYGVAMEFNPSDYGKRNEGDFVKIVLEAGKSPFFLLPFLVTPTPTEVVIQEAIDNFIAQGADMSDPRVRVVLARYDQPHVPIAGPTNSIESALARAKSMQ
eukprot:TRINITY_DN7232_c0_g1_i3.p1 TRINITY_DN7232_c0_g1~~TRINITY_DN7232_c0_g1_i3.p1  ORF type:complete len:144 (+),score=21.85 TRINITY_DN7232_c0_g1_i3:467-898(+)